MSTAELKIDLITKITNTDDDALLEEIQRMLNFELSEAIFKLNESQKAQISAARTAYRNGEFLTDNQANDEIQQWLEK